jgi:hypothetical protein
MAGYHRRGRNCYQGKSEPGSNVPRECSRITEGLEQPPSPKFLVLTKKAQEIWEKGGGMRAAGQAACSANEQKLRGTQQPASPTALTLNPSPTGVERGTSMIFFFKCSPRNSEALQLMYESLTLLSHQHLSRIGKTSRTDRS